MDAARSGTADVAVNAGLLAPHLPNVLVPRPGIEARIGPTTGAAWSLVVGPPGAGKTTLVRSWLTTQSAAWTWITVAESAARRPGLADLIVRGVQRCVAETLLDVLDALDMDVSDDLPLLERLLGELVAAGRSVVIVLDDVHHLGASEWSTLRSFLAQVTAGIHPVLIARSEPPIPLARDRASGRVAAVRGSELAFDLGETEQLVQRLGGAPGGSIASEVHARTEGWVAGVRLAALAIRDGADPDGLVDRLVDRRSSIAEFLIEELLDRLPPADRASLQTLAILDLLEPQLCTAVSGRRDIVDLLESLADDASFVVRIDGDADRYRFHALLGLLLRNESERRDPDGVRAARRRAADWFVGHDRAIEAIEHLLAAGDHERAHRLVVEFFHPLYVGAHRRDIDRWMVAVPDDVVMESLDRAVEHCAALALTANPEATRWWLYCSERVSPDDDWPASRLDCILAIGHAVNARLVEMISCWDLARGRRPPGRTDPLDEVLATWHVRVEALLRDPAVAVAVAHELQESSRDLVSDEVVLSVLAGALVATGDRDTGFAVAQRALERWRSNGEPELPGMVDALVVAATEARLERRFDHAEQLLDVADGLPPTHRRGPNVLTAIILVERARLDHARGGSRWASTLRVLAEELRAGPATPLVGWVLEQHDALGATVPDGSPASIADPSPGAPADELTERERSVLELLATHLSLPEIATRLYVSRHTVKTHVTHVYRKLGVNSRSEAVEVATERRLLPASSGKSA